MYLENRRFKIKVIYLQYFQNGNCISLELEKLSTLYLSII